MLKLAQMPGAQRTPERYLAGVSQSASHQQRYFAFLSYSHKDQAIADWLHRRLERFRVPAGLRTQSASVRILPATLRPIFRDRQELAAADDLGKQIRAALEHSQFLIVLCSPAAAQSKWTNAEVDAFKRVHRNGCVLAAIVAGEPFASEIAGHEHEECFPPALRQKYDRRGRPTSKRAEPIAADLRHSGDGKHLGVLKLVAGMLGVGLDELVQREARRKRRRHIWIAVGSIAATGLTAALATATIEAQMAAIHARYDAGDQHLQALSLQATEAIQSGDKRAAERLYEQALRGTAEAMRRRPNDPQRIFDHAQNVFYLGDLARERGDRATAEKYMIEYRRLAAREVELQPNNLKWRTEVQYADTNLALMLFDDRRFHEAGEQFSRAVQEGKELANAAPHDRARQNEVAHVIAWLAQTRLNQGRLREAVSLREQNLALLNSLFVRDADESDHQIELTNAQVALGSVYAATGRNKLALEHFRTAVANLERSIPLDNASAWYGTAIHARLALAAFTLDAGNPPEAAALTQSACSLADKLRDQTGANPFLLTERRDCWLMRTRLALASGRIAEALADARRAVETSKAIATGDHIADRFGQAKAYRLLGDAEKRSGSAAEASHAWSDALASMPPELTQTPREMDEYAQVLERMGRSTEATQIKSKLNAIGYHSAG